MSRVDYRHGLVIGKFYPPHLGHVYLIRTAAAHCQQVTVGVLGSSVESIGIAQRVAWLRETFADAPHVRIVGALDDVPIDYTSPAIWAAHVAVMRQAVQEADQLFGTTPTVDAVFTSEPYGQELARQFGSAHVCLDQSRSLYPTSGTAVRADPVAQWQMLPPAVQAGLALRVVVLGAESTGTTTLSHDLATALRQRGGVWARTAWVAEYGREYSHNLLALARAHNPVAGVADIAWQSSNFSAVAAEQCRREDQAARHGSPVLVCDTDAFATRLWHERYLGGPSAGVAAIAAAMPPRSLYLLTSDAGVDFEDDGLRDGAHLRGWMTGRFRELLGAQTVPWVEITGSPAERCRQALERVDACVAQTWRFTKPL
ncbi:AAA family ATPase [Rhodoferax sp.]|uniref:AAA family ATPase n=1 Tax=Rhodoferax sp. TaxID=50421 RepID=UPI0025E4BCFC|nr:AAA family ATPase [Rhodoferax sp.]